MHNFIWNFDAGPERIIKEIKTQCNLNPQVAEIPEKENISEQIGAFDDSFQNKIFSFVLFMRIVILK